ncbi:MULTISPECIES: DUF3090 domain-containing protein [Dietzia]|jgi:uncharacterized repeat protein (TIGR03847 family)|uniref:DUF3090 domain-containing protein n=1 Tax=Dietzia maris TaxID=37915 RepID=A0A365PE75_9ACTN|nr:MULTISPECIES: DUF3090 domain-containing protein [Dietzia]ODQ95141.1 hypothetical protein BFG51_13585 [Dietzia alimentaria]HBD22006.1 DUF3090 domain-containing protein [Dietzia sp.]MBB0995987.1 DUF3090 domain-containing protein [Dietzia maris]MDJ0421623.1 DUF3090 domain-containing protein [Dietzia kunjamensis]MDN4504759.1 DUF3090 domain-containing protein [Dietzia maris]
MSRAVHEFRDPTRFVVGTVGQPGERVFFVQATEAGRTISVRCEKQQAQILSERMGDLLDEIADKSDVPIPPAGGVVDDLDPLEMPVDAEFQVGTMGLGWDGEHSKIVVELLAMDPSATDESVVLSDAEDAPDALRVFLTPQRARQFVLRSEKVVSAGRAPCPLCGEPIDTTGHLCVRLNGYLPRSGETLTDLIDP